MYDTETADKMQIFSSSSSWCKLSQRRE